MTDKQYNSIVNSIQTIKKHYEEAGYEHALELEDEVNSILEKKHGLGSCIFDSFPEWPYHIESANCFHSGTWQIWNDDGEEDLISIFKNNYADEDDVSSFLYDYDVLNVKAIKKFIEVAEEWLKSKH